MAEIIASQTAAANSADFTLTDGSSCSLFLKDADADTDLYSNAVAYVQIKSSEAKYVTIGKLDFADPLSVLSAPGTFRVSKPASAYAFGVDKV
jgi:hypothetical protein